MLDWLYNVFNQREFATPVIVDKDRDYQTVLIERYSFLLHKLEEHNAPRNIYEQVSSIVGKVILSLTDYYKGNIASAQNSISEIITTLSDRPLAISHIKDACSFKGYFTSLDKNLKDFMNLDVNFFRARLSDDAAADLNAENMLHIGFDQREIITTQRFSIPGLPCLYFGTSSYDCWIEMDRPAENKFNVCTCRLDNSIKIFNLSVSQNDILTIAQYTDKYKLELPHYLDTLISLWILSYATSFTVKQKGKYFRSEYIISQLIMLAVKDQHLDGIAYLTKRIPTDILSTAVCHNLVIFAHYNGEKKLSSICKKIELSRAANYAEFKQLYASSQHSPCELFVDTSNPFVSLAGKFVHYNETEFHQFDKYLLQLPRCVCDVDSINS